MPKTRALVFFSFFQFLNVLRVAMPGLRQTKFEPFFRLLRQGSFFNAQLTICQYWLGLLQQKQVKHVLGNK